MVVYDENFEEIRRLFDPAEDKTLAHDQFRSRSLSPTILPRRPDPVPVVSSLVVFIDGACRGNGTPSARASYGVYFGPDSPHNTYGMLPKSLPQTSTRAEIEALSQALDIICQITDEDLLLSEIKIVAASSFLVNAMGRWMEGWIQEDGIGSNGRRVAHFDILRQLHDKLDHMEYSDDGGRQVEFWHLPRELNGEVDALANKAFDD